MIELVLQGKPRAVGSITVARLLPAPQRRLVGPFIFLDHMGPVTLPPGTGFDVLPHPHIGLSTVTYFLAGENVHRDSLGTVQVNRPLDLNLMTAGRGVVHSERAEPAFRERGGVMHGVQIWLALPAEHEDATPSFAHHPAATLPEIAPAADVRGRVLLGAAFGARSPVQHPSEPVLVDLVLAAGAVVELPVYAEERGVFVIEGELQITSSSTACLAGRPRERAEHTLGTDTLAVLEAGATVRATANAATRVMLIGGPPMGTRFIEWNFVATTKERIAEARAAWQAQTFPKIPGDDREFVPYPELGNGRKGTPIM